MHLRLLLALFALRHLPYQIKADSCNCGYIVPSQSPASSTIATSSTFATTLTSSTSGASTTTPQASAVPASGPSENLYFQQSLLSDFTKDALNEDQWLPQDYKLEPGASDGPLGRTASAKNVVSGNGDLQLWIRAALVDGHVSMAEINTVRRDIMYGSFRVGMKTPSTPGTSSSFFWYQNDTQQIDLNFLSRQMSESSHPANLNIPTVAYPMGSNPANNPGFRTIPLPSNPTYDFHEYRLDWVPTGVSVYVDGDLVDQITDSSIIPTSPGMLAISHWSNGNPDETGGPPAEDAVLEVSYVQAYFNTTGGGVPSKDTCSSNGQCIVSNAGASSSNSSSSAGSRAPAQPNSGDTNSTGAPANSTTTASAASPTPNSARLVYFEHPLFLLPGVLFAVSMGMYL